MSNSTVTRLSLMKKRKNKANSRPEDSKRTAAALEPSEVLSIFKRAGDRPLTWPEVRDRAGAERGDEVDRLRRVLRGLCHTGELYLDENGAYVARHHSPEMTGSVESAGRAGLVLAVDESGERWPIRLTRETRLRPGDTVSARVLQGQAVVSAVTRRSSRLLVGRLATSQHRGYVISESPDYRGRVYVASRDQGEASDGDSVAVEILGEDSYGLTGRVREVVAVRDDLHVASTTLLRAFDVPTEWPEDVERAVTELPERVDAASFGDRVDLTALPLVTIDGEDARDFDDAVFCERRRQGGWRLVVAIADVGHYVAHGSALDVSAALRGNSVYLPDRVVPMLPEALSNDLCSLRPRVPRLCVVCDMTVSREGRISGHKFYEAVMFSAARLTYTGVAAMLAGSALDVADPVRASLGEMHAVFRALLEAREARGGLDFEAREQKLVLENGLLERIVPVERNVAHRLIEEAMIAANVCAARFTEKHERLALYRVHEGPTAEKWELLRNALSFAGVRLPPATPKPADLKRVLDALAGRPDRWLLESLVLRSMSQATYSPGNVGHFGLALPRYMHFTSPIRRYADLGVHRVIKVLLAGRVPPDQDMPRLVAVGEHISMTERRADEVSREVGDWLKCEYAARFVGDTFEGTVVGVTDFGLFVELAGIYVQGLVHVSNLGGDFFRYDAARLALVGDRSGRRFALGDTLDVVLADVDPEARKIDLLLPERGATVPRRRADKHARGERRGRAPMHGRGRRKSR